MADADRLPRQVDALWLPRAFKPDASAYRIDGA